MNIWLVRLTSGSISLVNDNHVDNNLKEILVYVYSGSIVNNRSQNWQIFYQMYPVPLIYRLSDPDLVYIFSMLMYTLVYPSFTI